MSDATDERVKKLVTDVAYLKGEIAELRDELTRRDSFKPERRKAVTFLAIVLIALAFLLLTEQP